MSHTLVFQTRFPMSPERLFELHSRPEALARLSPPFPPIRSIQQDGGFESGATVHIRIGLGPMVASWLAELEDVQPGRKFVDVQKEGPFRSWRHVHRFLPTPDGCAMRDEVTWVSRGLLAPFDRVVVAPLLRGYFKRRHAALTRWVNEENEKTPRAGIGQLTEGS